jgi:hypothetical protein
MGVFMHPSVDIGDVFYKDGDIEVSTYTGAEIKELLKTASKARQSEFRFLTAAAYSLLPPSPRIQRATQAREPPTLSNSCFTVERSTAAGHPYLVLTIRQDFLSHSGETLCTIAANQGTIQANQGNICKNVLYIHTIFCPCTRTVCTWTRAQNK